ncbi:hypothetical protein J437_LFUL011516 [Ladona fulva]|uniref:Centromere protein J C-terminal domain-containing protein n=1 Tax=Ladona fulva TaxID=123851 RepID=A0A8K0K9J5_LADFU|nr:hypothetical protein J437_LFUL011516 [Ladona fulva]
MSDFNNTGRLIGNRKSIGNTKAVHQINAELTRTHPVSAVVKEGVVKSHCLLRKEPLKVPEELKQSENVDVERDDGNGVSLQRIQNAPNVLHKSHSAMDFADDDPGRKLESKDISGKCGSGAGLTNRSSANFIPQAPVRLREETNCQLIGKQSLRSEANNAVNSLSQYPRASTTFPSEKTNSDGSREIRYENGNFKKISPDGLNVKLFYFNGDVKETLSDGTIKYYYSETRTWHTTFPDGLEILEFPNGQVERHFQGTVEVAFPDGTVRIIQADGREELRLPDGTNVVANTNGDKIVSFPNGQKEYQTNDFKKRVYPDGTVKIVYSDGVQETRYSNGRVRLKDAAGSLLMDSES